MSATFNINLATSIDRIRQRIGDTDVSDATKVAAQNETIQAYLDQGFSELKTAARLCRDIAAQYAKVGDVNLDNQLSRTSQIFKHYIDLAIAIEAEERKATTTAATFSNIMVGGLSDTRGPLDP